MSLLVEIGDDDPKASPIDRRRRQFKLFNPGWRRRRRRSQTGDDDDNLVARSQIVSIILGSVSCDEGIPFSGKVVWPFTLHLRRITSPKLELASSIRRISNENGFDFSANAFNYSISAILVFSFCPADKSNYHTFWTGLLAAVDGHIWKLKQPQFDMGGPQKDLFSKSAR